ncbi:MAG: MCE family protein [Bacteroidia bacterium]|nr:MCE family protein [Bacteroidia bacterium]MCO5254894.1 MlaD family protein [Bacteroidota bacterium]
MKVSNESKIGALTAIAITFLILGYNYMANEGDMFKPKTYYIAVYDQTPGLRKGQSVLLNGYKVGYINSLSRDTKKNKIVTVLKIVEPLDVPIHSTAEIISEGLMGGKAIKLILNDNYDSYMKSGDTLLSHTEVSILDEITQSFEPIAKKIERIVDYLDSVVIKTGKVQGAITKTTDVMTSIENLANKSAHLVEANNDNITKTLESIKLLSTELASKRNELSKTLDNLGEFSNSLAKSDIIAKLDATLANISSITQKLDNGTGTAGKFVNDTELYEKLNATLADLNKLLIDINKYPEKYVPMPWGKKQRKDAKKKSSQESYNK